MPEANASSPLPANTASLDALESQAASFYQFAKYDEAEHAYRRLIELHAEKDGNEATYRDSYNLSAALAKQGKFSEAEAMIRQVLAFLVSRVKEGNVDNYEAQEVAAHKILEEAVAGQRTSEP